MAEAKKSRSAAVCFCLCESAPVLPSPLHSPVLCVPGGPPSRVTVFSFPPPHRPRRCLPRCSFVPRLTSGSSLRDHYRTFLLIAHVHTSARHATAARDFSPFSLLPRKPPPPFFTSLFCLFFAARLRSSPKPHRSRRRRANTERVVRALGFLRFKGEGERD